MIIEGEEKNFSGRFFSSPLIFPTHAKKQSCNRLSYYS